MRNYFTFLILIIINTITFPESAYSQKTSSKTFEYWSSGDGLSFKGEISYVANTYTGPQLRVKINYVEITAFTYKGVKYTNLNFPDSKSIKGTIYFDGNIWYGNYGAQQVDFKNCGITIELSKNTTTANYIQDNGSAYFSETITENYMDKEDVDRLKLDNNWKETWLKNASILRIDAVKHDYLSIKNGTGVKEYLIKQIEKEEEKEKFEKLLSSLAPYKQSEKTISFYDEGIKKIESLKAEFSTTEYIEKLNNLKEDINRKRSIAIDKEEVKKKLELEEKIAQRELQKKKIQRLTPDQIQRINQSIIYEKKVNQKINSGMSSDAAHRYVQQESRNETTNKMVESDLNSISNLVTNAIERRAQEKERINNDIYAYKESIVNYSNSLKKINNDFYKAFAGDIESLSKTETDIDKLKQEILWIFNSIGDAKYGHEFEFGKFNYKGTVIIEQKIEDVYFEGNILNIKLSQKAKEASYDKSHLSKDKYMQTPQPAKFVLNVTLKYDVEKEETTTYKNCHWPGVAVLTTNNSYLSETDYNNKIKNIDKNLYLKPKGGSWGTINAFNSFSHTLYSSFYNRLDLLKKSIKNKTTNNQVVSNNSQILTNNTNSNNEKPKPTKNNLESDMVFVEGGTFNMGSNYYPDEKPIHSITVNNFSIGKYEVTQAQWKAVMNNNPSYNNCDNCAVYNVSFDDVQLFLEKLNVLTGKNYRLPTEAEWEYAAKGGKKSKNYIYSGSNNISTVALYYENDNYKSIPVGHFNPNELGIYDMTGNVAEWCSDFFDKTYYSKSPNNNPKGPSSGKSRVVRGGSASERRYMDFCRITYRKEFVQYAKSFDTGFRVVISQ